MTKCIDCEEKLTHTNCTYVEDTECSRCDECAAELDNDWKEHLKQLDGGFD